MNAGAPVHPSARQTARRPGAPGTEKDLPDYPRTSTLALGLFLFYIVEVYLQMSYRFPQLGAIRFEFLLGGLLGVLAIFEASRSETAQAPAMKGLVAALFLCMLVQVPLSVAPGFSWDLFVDRVFKFALIGLFIAVFVRNPNALRWFLGAFLFACIRMCYEGLVGTITGGLIWENQGIPRLHGPTPNYGHPNSFAGMALGTLPFVLYLAPIGSWTVRLILAAQALLALNVVLRTGSRTGYVAFAVLLLVATLRAKRRIRNILVAAILVGAAIPFVPAEYLGRAASIITREDKEGASTQLREEILQDAWAIFKARPLGVGLGAFPLVRKQRFGRFQDTHNLYFEVATNLGIQGLVVFLTLLAVMLGVLNRLRREFSRQAARLGELLKRTPEKARDGTARRHERDLRLLEATSSAVLMFTVVRLALGLFGHDLYEVYWWFALGLTFAMLNVLRVATRKTDALCRAENPS